MFSAKDVLCEEIMEFEQLEDVVALFSDNPQCELIEIQPLSGKL
jgi:hypothetical protein